MVRFICFSITLLFSSPAFLFSQDGSDGTNAPRVSSGRIERHYVESQYVDARFVDVWLPDGYTESKRYPVLYMHDGQNLFEGSQSTSGLEWDVDGTLGKLIGENTINAVIVVGIHSRGLKRQAEFFPEKVIPTLPEAARVGLEATLVGPQRSDDYLKFIVEELKPLIDNRYSTATGQQTTFIGGSSLGALVSIYALSEYPNVFSRAACLSTHWIGTIYANSEIPEAIIAYLDENLPAPANHKIYFDYGSLGYDLFYKPYQDAVDAIMESKGYTSDQWITRSFPGTNHTETAWRERFDIPAAFLLTDIAIVASINNHVTGELGVYPNPISNAVSFSNYDQIIGKRFQITNNQGVVLYSGTVNKNYIDTSALGSGVYFIRVENKMSKLVKY